MKTGKDGRKTRGIGSSLVRSAQFTLSTSFIWLFGGTPRALAQVAAPPPGGLEPPPATKHEIAVSGDYLHGIGNVTLPFGFALADKGLILTPRQLGTPSRESDYFGATVSYSYGQQIYLDMSYAHGTSKGDFDPGSSVLGTMSDTSFKIEEDFYQAYLRYTFSMLHDTPFSAYLRAGVSYVPAELKDTSVVKGEYEERDEIEDVLGNVGFGVTYSLYSGKRAKIILNLEGEGFYGHRWQDIREETAAAGVATTSIENDLYGGIGRATIRFQYGVGQSGLLRLFADAGMGVKYTAIDYSDFDFGTRSELLWGPYVKVGFRYQFW